MGNAINEIKLSRGDWDQMLNNVESGLPDEACGLVGGINGVSKGVYGVENELNSPERFRMEAHELVQALLNIEANGLDLVAIYHSHPSGPSRPSQTDIDEFAYPGVPYLIWHLQDGEWSCRAFRIEAGVFSEIDLSIYADE